jgi:hypothetical protein
MGALYPEGYGLKRGKNSPNSTDEGSNWLTQCAPARSLCERRGTSVWSPAAQQARAPITFGAGGESAAARRRVAGEFLRKMWRQNERDAGKVRMLKGGARANLVAASALRHIQSIQRLRRSGTLTSAGNLSIIPAAKASRSGTERLRSNPGPRGAALLPPAGFCGRVFFARYSSSRCRGQASFNSRDRERSARITPPVWQPGQ